MLSVTLVPRVEGICWVKERLTGEIVPTLHPICGHTVTCHFPPVGKVMSFSEVRVKVAWPEPSREP